MELKFTKDAQSGNWVSEYEAKAVFNLHIEGAKKLMFYQRTAGSRYDEIEGEYKDGAYSFDYDFNALVYPKFIKIVSETEPTYAEVVSDGEITEIKSQTKEVEVTANGTTQVAPDAGYSYLTGVTVKTNVPQSGESGGGVSEYIKGIEYFAIDNDKLVELGYDRSNDSLIDPSGYLNRVVFTGCGGKLEANGVSMIMSAGALNIYRELFSSAKITGLYWINIYELNPDTGKYYITSLEELLGGEPLSVFKEAFTRITEEEFYTI